VGRRRKVLLTKIKKVRRHISILAIDPGVSGAAVFVDREGVIRDFFRLPTRKIKVGKKNRRLLDANELWVKLRNIQHELGIDVAVAEKVNSYGQGVTSAFTFGRSVGCVDGVLGSLGIKHEEITPQAWKKHCNLHKAEKDASVKLVRRHFDELRDIRDTDTGIADAALIALCYAQQRAAPIKIASKKRRSRNIVGSG
jgi:crossover junction endodeoxyribonuclease RuvC